MASGVSARLRVSSIAGSCSASDLWKRTVGMYYEQLSIVSPETVKELPPTEIARAGVLTIFKLENDPELLMLYSC